MYDVLTVVFAGVAMVFMVFIAVLFGWRVKKGKKGKK